MPNGFGMAGKTVWPPEVLKMQTSMILRPWAGAHAQGRTGLAALLFFMQVSLVLWPAAVRVALQLERERQMQMLLDELSAVHAPVVAEKHFRPADAALERVF
jgi:hypothetical protein